MGLTMVIGTERDNIARTVRTTFGKRDNVVRFKKRSAVRKLKTGGTAKFALPLGTGKCEVAHFTVAIMNGGSDVACPWRTIWRRRK
ncbi:MAG: hypothetical protein A3G25_18175 [Betaproteobacteria bacterium RIFCSPLOWO2_12_FULL_63_13]|nr:MAG: hypothetical protein A3G25_18175 [Betaproteobacteria bacterium RIFCSPLOWO2_12_FULL_63_13]